ncbi:MAG: amidase [Ignavibacteriales bacterium]|jgi:amidase|nr:MAG: amidase [Ignavibacteriales bacterium]
MKTMVEMKYALEHQQTTSVKLVEDAILSYTKWLDKNAIAMISPQALNQARVLDEERRMGHLRGPLHGIPIVIKDNIFYQDGTPTTANAYSLHDLFPPYHATIVSKLLEQGAIILGKANLSEFAYFMSYDDMPSGYGSMYGQVKHPFDETIDPYGSSTGSAVAVKLDIVPGSIGSETNGSLMAPAYQCQIVSIKPTFGLVSQHGMIPISPTQDTAGPMAHTVYDCAILLDAIADSKKKEALDITGSFLDQIEFPNPYRVGLIYPTNHAYTETENKILENATKNLQKIGIEVKKIDIELPHLDNDPTLLVEFKYAINAFLEEVKGSTKMSSLADIISYNEKHQERCLKYGQSILVKSNQTSGDLNDLSYLQKRHELLEKASLFEKVLKEERLTALALPYWLGFAPIYGNPSICIPEGVFEGQPKALVFVGHIGDDVSLIGLTHRYMTNKESKE